MPRTRDDFDELDDYEDDLAMTEPDEDDYEEPTPTRAREREPKPNRAQRRARKRSGLAVPEHAPQPKDRRPKKTAQQTEAEELEIVLTLWDEELRIDRSVIATSWDFQEGAVNKNPLQMVKGLLGPKQFGWFCMKARSEGLRPFEAANEVMNLFAEEGGFDSLGNS